MCWLSGVKAAHYLVHKGAHKINETALHLGELLGTISVHHGLEVEGEWGWEGERVQDEIKPPPKAKFIQE